MASAADTCYDVAPAFSRGASDLFDCSGKHQFCSEERWDVSIDRFLEDDSYLSELETGLESWSSTDTEEMSACGEALILEDFAASSHEAGGCDVAAPAVATATWSHHEATVPRAWTAHPAMPAEPETYVLAAHRDAVLNAAYVPAVNPALLPHGVAGIAGPSYSAPNSYHYSAPASYHYASAPYNCLPGPAVMDFKHQPVKRLCPIEFLEHDYVYEAFAPRPKSARISSKRTQDLLRIEAEAAATASAAAAVAAIAPLPPPSNAPVLEQVSPSCCPPTNRASQLPCKTTILQCCKFTSKQTQQACKGQLTIVPHKRGHLAVSCSSRHQWVWCSLCCNCHAGAKGGNINGRNRGCTVPTHWFERDAFDTGARNHMNVHKSGTTK